MSKVRVHELAKEFELENKEVIQRLNAADITAKTHSSSVDGDAARKVLSGGAEAKPASAVLGATLLLKHRCARTLRGSVSAKRPAEHKLRHSAAANASRKLGVTMPATVQPRWNLPMSNGL